jgi:hypothetical protein
MNRKQFTTLLVLVIVVGGLGWLLYKRDRASYSSGGTSLGGKVLGDFDVNAVARVTIKTSTNELTLVKQDDRWTVKERAGYPANFDNISSFLRDLAELKFVQREQIGASFLPRLELVPPGQGTNSGTLVELADKDGKTLRSVLLGKKHFKRQTEDGFGGGVADGRYVMVGNDTAQLGLVAESFNRAEAKPESWINKDFVKIDNAITFVMTAPVASNSWTLSRSNAVADWELQSVKAGEKLDQAKAAPLGSFFTMAGFNDVMKAPADLKSLGLDAPRVLKIRTLDGFHYELKIGATNEENAYLQIAVSAELPKERTPGKDEKAEDKEKLDKEFKERLEKLKDKLATEQQFAGWVYLVSKWTLDAVLKDRHEFLEAKPEAAPVTAPDPAAK